MPFGVPSFWLYMVMNAYLDACREYPFGFTAIATRNAYKREAE